MNVIFLNFKMAYNFGGVEQNGIHKLQAEEKLTVLMLCAPYVDVIAEIRTELLKY